ncbi:hypothetical protein RHMOL_Rhmol13G0243800 [Rhododendron molle]|uniref:Uncharacterized protein n=1 Tax=Rhododendron molle TaxID=49168 RepID=A0ACC0LAN0_RHOML|nr:hypothetical protein RHMOL_Rhmol13G0243800 [Rhododendron molle]
MVTGRGRPLTHALSQSGQYAPLMLFDCKRYEPMEFAFGSGWKVESLLSHIGSIGKEEKDIGIVNPGDVKFGSRKYYGYIGSLTVPPCTEGVIWTIVKKVRTVSREQVRALRDVVHDCVKCSLWSSRLREMKFEGYVAEDGSQVVV